MKEQQKYDNVNSLYGEENGPQHLNPVNKNNLIQLTDTVESKKLVHNYPQSLYQGYDDKTSKPIDTLPNSCRNRFPEANYKNVHQETSNISYDHLQNESPKISYDRIKQGNFCVQKGNLLEIVPDTSKVLDSVAADEVTTEDTITKQPSNKTKQQNSRDDTEKKRLEKKMRKEKLKSEIKKLVSVGVVDIDISSEDDGPFDDITRKGIFGTKDQGILRTTGSK